MAQPPHLFFDFDDTVSDFRTFGPQYVQNLSALLTREMGGVPEEWAAAILPALAVTGERYLERFRNNLLAGYNEWLNAERSRIVRDVFERAGKDAPDADSARQLAALLQERGLRGCNALYPGADAVLRSFGERGFPVFMASSQESAYLKGALTGCGAYFTIREFFGPDLIDCAKEGPEFYRRVFEQSGIRPSEAIVIDDQMMCLEWAYELGAKVVQARVREEPEPVGADLYFEDWGELPAIIDTLASTGTLTEDVGIKE